MGLSAGCHAMVLRYTTCRSASVNPAIPVGSGARFLERTMQDRKVVLDLEIRSTGVPACVEKLGAIGEIGGSFPPGGTAVLRTEIVSGI